MTLAIGLTVARATRATTEARLAVGLGLRGAQ